MTLPSEERRALKYVYEFLRDLLTIKAKDLRVGWIRKRASDLLRHYPWPIHIDERYADVVCAECGKDLQWCRCDNESKRDNQKENT